MILYNIHWVHSKGIRYQWVRWIRLCMMPTTLIKIPNNKLTSPFPPHKLNVSYSHHIPFPLCFSYIRQPRMYRDTLPFKAMMKIFKKFQLTGISYGTLTERPPTESPSDI